MTRQLTLTNTLLLIIAACCVALLVLVYLDRQPPPPDDRRGKARRPDMATKRDWDVAPRTPYEKTGTEG